MKKILAASFAAALALSLCTMALADKPALSDVHEGQWFYDEVNAMVEAGYITGYDDGTFMPGKEVSAVEFVTMTARSFGLETGEEYGHWAGRQMGRAYDLGWISERDCPYTEWNMPVDRQLACKILAVALGLNTESDYLPFKDYADVGQDYVRYMGAMYAEGLITGYEDNTLRPARVLTRAEAATLIYRAGEAGGELITVAPDGTPFAQNINLSNYDNPNFTIKVNSGKAVVDIHSIELWTDAADPASPEGQRRAAVTEAMKHTRIIPAVSSILNVWELPCTSTFPGRDAWAVIATADGRWYRVDLSGQYNEGVPELEEIPELRGKTITGLYWRSTTRVEDGAEVMGEDYLIARLGNYFEVAV